MGILQHKRKPAHDVGVIYVYERNSDLVPYYSAICLCGWYAEPIHSSDYPNPEAGRQVTAAALAHDSSADTNLYFPLDDPLD